MTPERKCCNHIHFMKIVLAVQTAPKRSPEICYPHLSINGRYFISNTLLPYGLAFRVTNRAFRNPYIQCPVYGHAPLKIHEFSQHYLYIFPFLYLTHTPYFSFFLRLLKILREFAYTSISSVRLSTSNCSSPFSSFTIILLLSIFLSWSVFTRLTYKQLGEVALFSISKQSR